MPEVIPSILVHSEEEFHERMNNHTIHVLAPLWHFDILDRSMFDAASWADVDVVAKSDVLPILELHLMVQKPVDTLLAWKHKINHVKRAIIHAEISTSVEEELARIKSLSLETGLAVNPGTDIDSIEDYMHQVDLLLIMGVEPGKSGQSFIAEQTLSKIEEAKLRYPHVRIAVDGGVNEGNAKDIVAAGADQLVTASALWGSKDIRSTFAKLKQA
jgi:ribulose-phosphate 3-epimerase